MTSTPQARPVHDFRTLPKDIGVALVVVVALALGLGLRYQADSRMTTFDKQPPFRIIYPATWGSATKPISATDVLLQVEDPRASSAYKTTLTVESRGLDPQSPPTLQQLVDRRVAQNGRQTGYHLLSTQEATVGGAKAMRQEYAYVVQPIDQPRRASLPVVVHATEYVVVTKDNVYYITLAAAEEDFADASARMEQIIQSVRVQ